MDTKYWTCFFSHSFHMLWMTWLSLRIDQTTAMDSIHKFGGRIHADFRFYIKAYAVECFFQELPEGARFHVAFEVIQGDDRKINFRVGGPGGRIVVNKEWETEGFHEQPITVPGIYSICLGNTLSRIHRKLVQVYIFAYRPQDWEGLVQQLDEFKNSTGSLSSSLSVIDKSVQSVQKTLWKGRSLEAADYILVMESNSLVQNMSLAMCFMILAAACSQVYFMRRMFTVPVATKTGKPRA